MIIRVPVITHTIYKIVEKGHKHSGHVVHHHHHDGHVSHVHKHDGEAHHKHHHQGSAGHHHSHTGNTDHKHSHAGKAEHGHHHKGHGSHDHHHQGHHGHDHKHTGVFSTAHAHSGSGWHSHGHSGGSHGHGHTSTAHDYGMPVYGFVHPNKFPNEEYQTPWFGFHAPLPVPPKLPISTKYNPFGPGLSAPPYTPATSAMDGNLKPYQGYVAYSPEYGYQYTNVKGRGGMTYVMQNAKQNPNPEYVQEPKGQKTVVGMQPQQFNLFSPEETAELENSLTNFDEFGNNSDGGKTAIPTAEFEPPENGATFEEGFNDVTGEMDKGEHQLTNMQLPFPKRRTTQKYLLPIVPYEVTEKINAIL